MRNAQGFDEFYRTTSRRLLGYAYAVSRDWAQAQDLTQEAYLRAWRHWNKLSHYADPEAWLRLVVVRLATDFWRRLGRRDTAYQRTAASTTDAAAPSEETVMVTKALLALPAQQRQAIAMHYLFDLPVAQIADDLRVPEGTVKSWLSRGRIALADLLDPERERAIPAGSQVRAAGDRRARRRAVVGAVTAVLVLLAGVVWASTAIRGDGSPIDPIQSPSMAPSVPPSPSVSPAPSRPPLPRPSGTDLPAVGVCDDPYPKTLPAELFQMGFQRRELCFKPRTQQGNPPLELILPHPCRPMTHASDALILDRRAKQVTHNEGTADQPAMVQWAHTVTKYGPGGSEAYLTELREALDRCGTFTTSDGRTLDYKELTGFGAGPDRVVIREEWTKPNAEETEAKSGDALILVQRVKDYVIVIFDWGWEVFPSEDETITTAMTNATGVVNAL